MTDPAHPLFGKTFKLVGLAHLPGHIRHCQVEILPDQYGFIPVASTNLNTEPRPQPTLLTMDTIQELVATYQAEVLARRGSHATSNTRKTDRVGLPRGGRTKRSDRRNHPDTDGGSRK